jgi:uncharacterized iron-regulated membrane protein
MKKLRNQLSTLHGFIGILGGLLLVVMGLTGSAIVFHQEIDRALNPQLMQVTPQGKRVEIDALMTAAQAHIPSSRLESIQIPQAPNESYRISVKTEAKTEHEIFVNPYTGKVLGDRQSKISPVGFIYAIHHDLFAGKFGLYLVGISGLILMLQAITGLILWTGWRKLANGFRIRWQAPIPLLSFDLHNVGGAVFNIFLLITGFTGVVIVGAHILLDPGAEAAKVAPPFQSTISLSGMLRKADAAIPEGVTTAIAFPDEKTLVVTKKLPQDHPRFYFSSVTVDGATGKTLEVSKIAETPPMWKFLIPVAELHFGTFGGLPTRIFYLLLGLMPTVLFMTGLVNWRRRRLLGGRREAAIQVAEQLRESSVR